MLVLYPTWCTTLPEQCNSLEGGKPTPVAVPQILYTAGIERKEAGALHNGSAPCDALLGMEQWFEDAGEHRARGRIAPGCPGALGFSGRSGEAVCCCPSV